MQKDEQQNSGTSLTADAAVSAVSQGQLSHDAPPRLPIKVWLDDIRDPAHFGHFGWTWVRTVDAFIALMKTGNVAAVSLDHDLSINATIGQPCTEPTGYDAVLWMEQHGIWPHEKPEVHSMNPVGAARMRQAINRHYEGNSR